MAPANGSTCSCRGHTRQPAALLAVMVEAASWGASVKWPPFSPGQQLRQLSR